MSTDPVVLSILGAMLRLARRRKAADEGAIAVRVGGSPEVVRAALRRLDAGGLVERRLAEPPRLTMAGFAVAVSLLPGQPAATQPARQPRQVAGVRRARTSRAA
jgi:Mn-dependent DtxR family transcriptional regulator